MLPVPELNRADVIFGNIKHLPKWDDIPEPFRKGWSRGEPHCEFVSRWFFDGLAKEEIDRLRPRDGVDKSMALAAIKAALGSWEPQHERKIAGLGYLLSEWFELAPAT